MTHNIGRPMTGLGPDRLERATQQLAAALLKLVEAALDSHVPAAAIAAPPPEPADEGRIRPRGWYSIDEVAEIARRHPTTIAKAARAGDLPGHQRVARGRWLVRGADLERWLTAKR